MSVVSDGPNRWKIITKKGREVIIEAPYVTTEEVRLIQVMLDEVIDGVVDLLVNNYVLDFTFTLPTGQTVKVQTRFVKSGLNV
jgi:hypothetical protein